MVKTESSATATILSRFPSRRMMQYRLRTIFILTTLAAILFAFLGWWSHNARRQRNAFAALRTRCSRIIAPDGMFVGPGIYYDFQEVHSRQCPRAPVWLVNALGVDYFANVHSVYFRESEFADVDLVHLQAFSAIQLLDFRETSVGDVGLENIKGLTTLRKLNLAKTAVTDDGLKHLQKLRKLESLGLSDTQITDAGLEHLMGLMALQELDLYRTQVSAAGVARLHKSLPNCKIGH